MSTTTVAKSYERIEPGLVIVTKSGRDIYKSTVYAKHFKNGEDVNTWPVASITKTEAKQRHRARRAEAQSVKYEVTDQTLGHVKTECLAYLRAELERDGKNTEYADLLETHWRKRVVPAGLADIKLSRFDQPTALRFLRYLRTTGLAPNTQNGSLTVVRTTLRFARENGNMPASFDPFLGIKRSEFPPQKPVKDLRVLDNEEAAALHRALLGETFRAQADTDYSNIILVNLLEGHRASETCGLRWSDVDFENRRLAVNGQAARDGSGQRVQTKNRQTREKAMHSQTHRALVRQREIEWSKGLGRDDDPVFTMFHGKPITRQYLYEATVRAAGLAGLGKIGPQVLRRSFCTALAHAGIPAVEGAAMAGHSVQVHNAAYVWPHEKQKQMAANTEALESYGFGAIVEAV